jgi:nucleoside-diphosphate-sugar epimerase
VRRLLAEGDEVRALVLPEDPFAGELRSLAAAERQLQVIEADICNTASIAPAFEGADRVFHSAALVHAWAPATRFREVNVGGTRNVAEVALASGVRRLIWISTTDVFGLPRGDEVFDEDSPLRPWNEPYADTKIEAERWLWRFHRDSGMPVSVVYPGWVYGPGDRAFFPGLAQGIASGAMFFWRRDARLPLVFVDNLIDACLRASTVQAAIGRGYIVYDSQELTLEEICGRIADTISARRPKLHIPYRLAYAAATILRMKARMARKPTPPLLLTVDVKAFGMQWFFSNERAHTELCWTPRVGMEEGMQRALEDLSRRFPVKHPGA